MKQIVLEKLDWSHLTGQLAELSETDAGKRLCATLTPSLQQEAIEDRWRAVGPLKDLLDSSYRPPLSELPVMDKILRAVDMGQVLAGEEYRLILGMLEQTKAVHKFAADFAGKCQPLSHFKSNAYPLPRVMEAINKTIGPDGELRDDASPELQKIRQAKLSLRKRIEQKIKQLTNDPEVAKYLQDDFFTIRSERYVVPLKLDGRGRVKGSIYDTSDSGQTLFVEPSSIAPLNEDLLELDLSEKLEIIRIFRELGELVGQEVDTLRINYEQLVELDFLVAQARLAARLRANPVTISNEKILDLRQARHPLVRTTDGREPVPNNIALEPAQRALIVSGPNAGGKTVVLKTVGMLIAMAKAGLMLPADMESRIYLYDDVYLEMGDRQSLEASLSTFSGHILGLKPIVTQAGERDLVLLDEIAAGTEPQAGAAIAQSILEHLVAREASVIVTTHFDALKTLAVSDPRFRNGSMEYSTTNFRPTYNLVLDVPGQSFGIEVAEQMGLPATIISRAKTLRGSAANQLDEVVAKLNEEREKISQKQVDIDRIRIEAESTKAHWQREKQSLQEARKRTAAELAARFEETLSNLRTEYNQSLDALRKQIRTLSKREAITESDRQEFQDLKRQGFESLARYDEQMAALQAQAEDQAPGDAANMENLIVGRRVYVKSLAQEGTVAKIQSAQNIEVQIGLLNTRVPLDDLNVLSESTKQSRKKRARINAGPSGKSGREISLTLQTHTNSIDLRGLEQGEALDRSWKFIDEALLRGESRILLIHGHGMNKLKNYLREQLTHNCPYNIRFRAGEDQEGGDGVTVIALDH